jgi:hypothetical protein
MRAADRSASQQAAPSSFAYILNAPESCRRCVAKQVSFITYSKAETMAATRINPDAFLQTDGGRVWTPERNAEAWRRSFEALDSALERGEASRVIVVCGLQGAGKSTWIDQQPDTKSVIYFDGALPGARHRKPIIEIARKHHAKIEAVWINVPLALALERNASRSPDQIVPEESIRSVASRFEPPSIEEGFENVSVVIVR